MKLVPFTTDELEFIKWQIWEPLRRREDYRSEFARLKQDLLGLDLEDKFCQKWNLSSPVDPSLPFDELYKVMTRGKTKKEVIRERREWMDKCGLNTNKVDFDKICRAKEGLSKEDTNERIRQLFWFGYPKEEESKEGGPYQVAPL